MSNYPLCDACAPEQTAATHRHRFGDGERVHLCSDHHGKATDLLAEDPDLTSAELLDKLSDLTTTEEHR